MFVAVDLGATSGRVITARFRDGVVDAEILHRFPNGPVARGDDLHWDVEGLFQHVVEGLGKIESYSEPVQSIGIDSWAVDYGLVADGELISPPHHYRDSRSGRGADAVHRKIAFEKLYARNGLQFLPFNTIYQLAAEDWANEASQAENFLLIPDLIGFWFTGEMVTEATNASTTGLLEAGADSWSDNLVSLSGAPRKLFGPIVHPGQQVGRVKDNIADGVRGVSLVAVGSHDTASAVLATPLRGRNSAYISLGTWGLVGIEVDRPVVTDEARVANFTNEAAVDGSVRFLRNVMGLWVVNECVSDWRKRDSGLFLEYLIRQVERMKNPRMLVDLNDPVFAPPGDMPGRVANWLRERYGEAPDSPVEVVNILLSSLAHAYSDAVRKAGELADIDIHEINIVGGGSQNHVLCQRVADVSGLRVVAGPTEATALGNILLQANAAGLLPDGSEHIRDVVRASVNLTEFTPRA